MPSNYSPSHSDSCFSDNNTYSLNINSSSPDTFEYGMTNIDIGTAGSIPLVLLTIIPTIDYLRYVVRELFFPFRIIYVSINCFSFLLQIIIIFRKMFFNIKY